MTMASGAGPGAAGPGPGRSAGRRLALVVLCVGQLMIVLDGSALNVALPTIQRDLGFTQAGLSWVVNAYLMTFGGFLLLAGRLGDLVGRRRMFLGGLAGFTVASLLCGLAQSRGELVAARFVQGSAAAVDSAMVLGILVTLFADVRRRQRALSVYALVSSVGGSVGVFVGGLVTTALGWHWIFFLNVPVGIAVFALGGALLAESDAAGIRRGLDVVGAVLVTAAATMTVWALVGAADHGWSSAVTLGGLAGAAALAAAFVLRERTASDPLVPAGIFRHSNIGPANLVRASAGIGLFGMTFLGVLYLQHVLGYSALRAGVAFVPLNTVLSFSAIVLAPRWVRLVGIRWALVSALALLGASLAWFGQVPVDASYVRDVLGPMLAFGVAAGLLFLPSITFAMSEAAPGDSGLRSGLANTSLQLGSALGVALLASVSTARTRDLLVAGVSSPIALTAGYRLAFRVAAGAAGVAIVLSFLLRTDRVTALTDVRGARTGRAGPADEASLQEDPVAGDRTREV
jgi:EmrB/QacA subfamily drug resistance transporter